MMEIVFYFTLKDLFVLSMFKVLACFLVKQKNRLGQKDQINFKTYYFTIWETSKCNTLITRNIPRSRGSQTRNFRQLIEYNMRKKFFFLKNHAQNILVKLSPDLFKVKIKQIYGSIVQSFTHFVFIVCQVESYQKILKLRSRPL